MHNEYNGKSFVSWQQLFMFSTLINTDVDFETIFLTCILTKYSHQSTFDRESAS